MFDASPSTLIPFYDYDTNVVFLTGKVGRSISCSVLLPKNNRMLPSQCFAYLR